MTRIAAHPLVVAVAFGLLSPEALAPMRTTRDDGAEESLDETLGTHDVVEPIDAEEFARVEREWFLARNIDL